MVVQLTLVFVGRGHRLRQKIDLIEPGEAKGALQPINRELIVGRILGAAEMDRTADYESGSQVTELLFRGFSQIAKQDADQFFERIGFAENLRLIEQAACQIRLCRLDEPAGRFRIEITLYRVRSGNHAEVLRSRSVVFFEV